MSNKQFSLAVSGRNSFIRTNEKDGSSYRIWCYYVHKENDNEALLQFAEDVRAAGYNVLHDDETGEMIYKTPYPVPVGCNIIRTQAGKWVADTSTMDLQEQMAKRYPHLFKGFGEALAKQMLNGNKRTVNRQEPKDDNNIDPFAG